MDNAGVFAESARLAKAGLEVAFGLGEEGLEVVEICAGGAVGHFLGGAAFFAGTDVFEDVDTLSFGDAEFG